MGSCSEQVKEPAGARQNARIGTEGSSPPVPVNKSGSGRGTAPGLRFGFWVWHPHFMVVEFAPLPQAADLLLFKLTKALLAPALTDPQPDRKDQLHHAAFVPQVGNNLGAAALLLKGALRQVRGADILLMTLGDIEVVETGFGSVPQAATSF